MTTHHRIATVALWVTAAAAGLGGCTPPPATSAPLPPAAAPGITPGMQYLYGSGEGAAISMQAWRSLVRYVADQVRARPADSVVLAPGASLAAPSFVPCGDKPLAAVFDVDETVLLNLGFESDAATHPGPFDQTRWDAWERDAASVGKVAPVPGAASALRVLRQIGVTVIFNTNRSVASAAVTEASLAAAGLGPAKHGDTLYLLGDDANGSNKDGRRATIAARYCVIAMAGDQLGDFSNLFNAAPLKTDPIARRRTALAEPIITKWGAGWFVLPNPVYGTGLAGAFDTVFPPAVRWGDQSK